MSEDRFMTEQQQDREIEDAAPWGEEEKRLRAIRNRRRAAGECILCGKPLGFFDRRAKREQHPDCNRFVE